MDAELCEVNNFSQTRPKYLLTNYLQAGAHACQPGDSLYTHQVIFVFSIFIKILPAYYNKHLGPLPILFQEVLNSENTPIQKLIKYFENYFPLNSAECDELMSRFTERKVKRRQFILQQGDVCRYFTFVVSGCLKMYAVDKNGKEHNIEFSAENDWIIDLSSFYSEKSGQLYIEAIEPTMVLQIKHDDLLYLYINYHKFDRNFRIVIEQKYIELQNRVLQNISSTAEERYEFFLTQYPNLANRLPNTQIASYLGITPEFLSTIRKSRVYKS